MPPKDRVCQKYFIKTKGPGLMRIMCWLINLVIIIFQASNSCSSALSIYSLLSDFPPNQIESVAESRTVDGHCQGDIHGSCACAAIVQRRHCRRASKHKRNKVKKTNWMELLGAKCLRRNLQLPSPALIASSPPIAAKVAWAFSLCFDSIWCPSRQRNQQDAVSPAAGAGARAGQLVTEWRWLPGSSQLICCWVLLICMLVMVLLHIRPGQGQCLQFQWECTERKNIKELWSILWKKYT